ANILPSSSTLNYPDIIFLLTKALKRRDLYLFGDTRPLYVQMIWSGRDETNIEQLVIEIIFIQNIENEEINACDSRRDATFLF
uniref:Uncharacterized protein n=1 Tax=Echinococcus canadensis TaxID=519352 RepID=A0A915EYZ8_9CEST